MSDGVLSRRTVLKGLSAAGLASSLAASSQANTANDQAINCAIISEPSAGHLSAFLRGFSQCRGVGRVAVSDSKSASFEVAQRTLGDRFEAGFRDHQEMLDKFQPKLTLVTMESRHTAAVVSAVLRADSHVMTEKPGYMSVEQLEPLVKIADQKQLHLMMALATRSSAAIKRARKLIQDGWLGKPYACTLDWIADQTRLTRPQYQQSWLSFKDRAGGGKLIYHGIHYLDVIQYLVDDPIQHVGAFCENVGGQPIEVEDAAVLSFRFQNGMVGTLNTGYYLDQGYQNQIRVWGSKGWFHLNLPDRKPLEWHSTHADAPEGVQYFQYDDKPGLYELLLQEAVDACRGVAPPPITGPEVLQVLKVVYSAYEASHSGVMQRVV